MGLVVVRKPITKPDSAVFLDRGDDKVMGLSGYWIFHKPKAAVVKNLAHPSLGNLTLGAGQSRVIDTGGRGISGTNATNSYATSGMSPAQLGIDGAKRRTIFCRFKAAAASSSTNQGGLFSVGSVVSGNTLFSVHQVNDAAPNNSPNQWCVNYNGGKLYFLVPNTAGKVHTLAVIYDGSSIQVYVDGQFQIGQQVALNTGTANFDIGRVLLGTDASRNYFNGTIYEIGVVGGRDWSARQMLEWSHRPLSLLQGQKAILFTNGSGAALSIALTGLRPTGGIGILAVQSTNYDVLLSGLGPTGGIGNMNLYTISSTDQQIFSPGLGPSGGIGTLTLFRQAGFWNPINPGGGNWTPVPNLTGG